MIETFLKTSLDSMSAATKIVVDSTIKNEALAETYVKFIDNQNETAKKSVEATCEFGRELYKTTTNSEYYTDTMKTLQNSMKSAKSFFNKN